MIPPAVNFSPPDFFPLNRILKYRMTILRVVVLLSIATAFVFCMPSGLFDKPVSTVLYASDGTLLSGSIAIDGQWRFPAADSVPYKFKVALIEFEDRHFNEHNGIYLPSVFRAIKQNLTKGEVVSGASTLTMQVIRITREHPPRSMSEKLLEMIMALRLECAASKEEILSRYASNAPYGGNVVGLEAASWRYFGRAPHQLTWAESATLAVLPNAPSLIFPGKNQEALLKKRNKLLQTLCNRGYFDQQTLELSFIEPLPEKPYPLPQSAQHLLFTLSGQHNDTHRFSTSINRDLQEQLSDLVERHHRVLSANNVENIAAVVIDVKTGLPLAYVGNTRDANNRFGNMVDIVQAPRSTGSILKPFLYAAALSDGQILPQTLLPDIPITYEGFSPKNYSETFDGAVHASQALSRSLNIPTVELLKDYSYPRFYHLLQRLQFSHFKQPADHYGLSIILGGGEASLWDISQAYAGMSRELAYFHTSNGKYDARNFEQKYLIPGNPISTEESEFAPINAGAVWCTYQSLLEVNRPENELGWETYSSATPIAWKTGTSFGNRDAWAVGSTPEYVIGIWVGNADGQGRPDLTGVTSAAPLLFDAFNLLPSRTWFSPPYDDLVQIPTCRESGMRAGMYCPNVDSVFVPKSGANSLPCAFHHLIHIDANTGERLSAECANGRAMVETPWFTLPPVQEYYYKNRHPDYQAPPAFAADCAGNEINPIGLIYPKGNAKIYVPKNFSGQTEKVVLQAAHSSNDATLYWHIDDQYIGTTTHIHQLAIQPVVGEHLLTIEDEAGHTLFKRFEIVSK